ncbi:MAG: cytochrome P450 [Okeania sp. SIO3B5]|uniref:cytochrome P450 n=1 Tax=Okeania sp. SIO3B5 TaxID=2607811 RepID=UPI0014009103|nr:cytochrome P450 [Okeania sp. SIO3B5]NEO57363.1 cytochrome P450 [Okeania sp. SIO3B5]
MTNSERTENALTRRPMPLWLHLWARVNRWGERLLGTFWLFRYFSSPFPGVLAHHFGPNLFQDHGNAFRQATVDRGEPTSNYFRTSGISACAEANGGVCSFRLNGEIAIYQNTNVPLVRDNVLAPSTNPVTEIFGDFVGTLPNDHPLRPGKRAAVESSLGNLNFVAKLEPAVRKHAVDYLKSVARKEMPLDDFALFLVAHVDSFVPGILDLTQTPLTSYLASTEYGRVTRDFIDVASEAIGKVNPAAMSDFETIIPFVRTLLTDNFDALEAAPDSNLIRRHFALWERSLTIPEIENLDPAKLKELGAIIVATYETTALSILWLLVFLETSPDIKASVVTEARSGGNEEKLSFINKAVLEALRLGGSNPTALWRRTTTPFVLQHQGRSVTVPPGTMMWLDRQQANSDPSIFPNPNLFDPANIDAILKSNRENLNSVLARDRYEINSFSMTNSQGNPRKCPGRIFSTQIQSILLSELYSRYEVSTQGIDLHLKHYKTMPRPAQPGTIVIEPLAE